MESTYTGYYPEKVAEIAKLDEGHIKDLRNHHFKLGFGKWGPETELSEAKTQYLDKRNPDDLKKEMEKVKEASRASSKLWVDENKYFNTLYGESFNNCAKIDPKDVFSKSDIRNRLLTLRSSNIHMGNSKRDMNTGNTKFYNDKSLASQKMNTHTNQNNIPMARVQNFYITSGPGDFQTCNKIDFTKKPNEAAKNKEAVDKHTKDLRSIL